VFASIGVVSSVRFAYIAWTWPRTFAPPFGFLMMEIRTAGDSAPRRSTIYLAGSTDARDVRFEGQHLTWRKAKIANRQSIVPFDGFVVEGTGRVVFGKSTITIEDDRIVINGEIVQPRDFTVTLDGRARDGAISIAR
jgi:hypothetical protein